jgi:hypothetical protein
LSIYVEEGPDTTIKTLFPIPKLPLIQNIPQISCSDLDGAPRSGTFLPKPLELAQIFLDGGSLSFAMCGRCQSNEGGYSLVASESFHS